MPLSPGIEITTGFRVYAPKPIDARQGIFLDTLDAKNSIDVNTRYQGLIVYVYKNGMIGDPIDEYWWREGVEDNDLVLKTNTSSSSLDFVADTLEDKDNLVFYDLSDSRLTDIRTNISIKYSTESLNGSNNKSPALLFKGNLTEQLIHSSGLAFKSSNLDNDYTIDLDFISGNDEPIFDRPKFSIRVRDEGIDTLFTSNTWRDVVTIESLFKRAGTNGSISGQDFGDVVLYGGILTFNPSPVQGNVTGTIKLPNNPILPNDSYDFTGALRYNTRLEVYDNGWNSVANELEYTSNIGSANDPVVLYDVSKNELTSKNFKLINPETTDYDSLGLEISSTIDTTRNSTYYSDGLLFTSTKSSTQTSKDFTLSFDILGHADFNDTYGDISFKVNRNGVGGTKSYEEFLRITTLYDRGLNKIDASDLRPSWGDLQIFGGIINFVPSASGAIGTVILPSDATVPVDSFTFTGALRYNGSLQVYDGGWQNISGGSGLSGFSNIAGGEPVGKDIVGGSTLRLRSIAGINGITVTTIGDVITIDGAVSDTTDAAGSTNQIQYNVNNDFAADEGFTFSILGSTKTFNIHESNGYGLTFETIEDTSSKLTLTDSTKVIALDIIANNIIRSTNLSNGTELRFQSNDNLVGQGLKIDVSNSLGNALSNTDYLLLETGTIQLLKFKKNKVLELNATHTAGISQDHDVITKAYGDANYFNSGGTAVPGGEEASIQFKNGNNFDGNKLFKFRYNNLDGGEAFLTLGNDSEVLRRINFDSNVDSIGRERNDINFKVSPFYTLSISNIDQGNNVNHNNHYNIIRGYNNTIGISNSALALGALSTGDAVGYDPVMQFISSKSETSLSTSFNTRATFGWYNGFNRIMTLQDNKLILTFDHTNNITNDHDVVTKKYFDDNVGSGGEANIITTIGSGVQIYKQKTGAAFELRGITGDSNIDVTVVGNDVNLALSSSVLDNVLPTVGTNVGTGLGPKNIYKDVQIIDGKRKLRFRTLIGAGGIEVKQFGDNIQIENTLSTTGAKDWILRADGNGGIQSDDNLTYNVTNSNTKYFRVANGSGNNNTPQSILGFDENSSNDMGYLKVASKSEDQSVIVTSNGRNNSLWGNYIRASTVNNGSTGLAIYVRTPDNNSKSAFSFYAQDINGNSLSGTTLMDFRKGNELIYQLFNNGLMRLNPTHTASISNDDDIITKGYADAVYGSSGGVAGIQGVINVGTTGQSLVQGISNQIVQLKGLQSGSNISLSYNSSNKTVVISSTAGGTTINNLKDSGLGIVNNNSGKFTWQNIVLDGNVIKHTNSNINNIQLLNNDIFLPSLGGNGNQMLYVDSAGQIRAQDIPDGGTGGITGASSIGSGIEVYDNVVNGDLKFRSLAEGSNITISESNGNITISATGGGGSPFVNLDESGGDVFNTANATGTFRWRELTLSDDRIGNGSNSYLDLASGGTTTLYGSSIIIDSSDITLSLNGNGNRFVYIDNNDKLQTTPLFTPFSGDYDDLSNKPVLFSGNYEDLNNEPFDITNSNVTNLITGGYFQWENIRLNGTVISHQGANGIALPSGGGVVIQNLSGTGDRVVGVDSAGKLKIVTVSGGTGGLENLIDSNNNVLNTTSGFFQWEKIRIENNKILYALSEQSSSNNNAVVFNSDGTITIEDLSGNGSGFVTVNNEGDLGFSTATGIQNLIDDGSDNVVNKAGVTGSFKWLDTTIQNHVSGAKIGYQNAAGIILLGGASAGIVRLESYSGTNNRVLTVNSSGNIEAGQVTLINNLQDVGDNIKSIPTLTSSAYFEWKNIRIGDNYIKHKSSQDSIILKNNGGLTIEAFSHGENEDKMLVVNDDGEVSYSNIINGLENLKDSNNGGVENSSTGINDFSWNGVRLTSAGQVIASSLENNENENRIVLATKGGRLFTGSAQLTNLEDQGANVVNSSTGTGYFQWEDVRLDGTGVYGNNSFSGFIVHAHHTDDNKILSLRGGSLQDNGGHIKIYGKDNLINSGGIDFVIGKNNFSNIGEFSFIRRVAGSTTNLMSLNADGDLKVNNLGDLSNTRVVGVSPNGTLVRLSNNELADLVINDVDYQVNVTNIVDDKADSGVYTPVTAETNLISSFGTTTNNWVWIRVGDKIIMTGRITFNANVPLAQQNTASITVPTGFNVSGTKVHGGILNATASGVETPEYLYAVYNGVDNSKIDLVFNTVLYAANREWTVFIMYDSTFNP